ncbi:MAG: phosphopantothenate/pantothenate synthetase [Acidilobaceae archaeon]|nr:phosphopantothenate/pantothenate synthetase [Acidilobaceae archaeon]MCX8165927.1 4-phosphopantoate--beta-alanine ligase [Acidilobaceae archaeon]MDW7974570.1 4-phosphopantoate--beta-alanine ligase [Sulfolobales archaeon]
MRWHIPESHPRYKSLVAREKVVEAFLEGAVVPQGLIAQGRGEAFDYLLGEVSHPFALQAERAAVAAMLLAQKPVISVNGNYAALAAAEIAELSSELGVKVEVNIFYRTEERVAKIEGMLRRAGVREVLGASCEKTRLPNLESPRGIVCKEGIYSADLVMVSIEDGDRTKALRELGKKVIAIDLNPFSRTAQLAHITIVDEAVRATQNMVKIARELKGLDRPSLEKILSSFDNARALSEAFRAIMVRLEDASKRGLLLEPP